MSAKSRFVEVGAEDTRRAFQMAIQAMMATILEAKDVPQDQQYTLSADLKRLVPAQEE